MAQTLSKSDLLSDLHTTSWKSSQEAEFLKLVYVLSHSLIFLQALANFDPLFEKRLVAYAKESKGKTSPTALELSEQDSVHTGGLIKLQSRCRAY